MTEQNARKVVKVVVLGDIGRSPRMQYHALSLAGCGFDVNMIGYVETKPLSNIQENPRITVTKLHPLKIEWAPKLLQYFAKALWQAISLLLTLFITGKSSHLLCQNPPAVPTLPICRFYCLVTHTKFIIDWHNYAFSIMALSLSCNHPVLKVSTYIEKFFGQSSDSNLCVTYAMKQDLLENFNVMATVLYDRPPNIFKPITVQEKHNWFVKIGSQYKEFIASKIDASDIARHSDTRHTAFTEVEGNLVKLKTNRPGLLFSSTSWTADEDFSILMEALQVYETTFDLVKNLPKLICVITGKGPMKEYYKEQISSRKWQHVTVITPWLEACDYPTMVASADLGVCLHTSSSGLDLPMKVVDMFGAGLPVCAYDFKCLDELVQNGENGYTFRTSDELSKQIVSWFQDFPNNEKQNKAADKMRENLKKFQESRWEDNWNLRAKKLFE
ncbi:chitobiosyldiphosphodolichol beta-mannosyltransferase [Vanessa atalanta]|uniref:chitobiosyldiphosphodolichol beta-mannosyltransferase n=1 Tax=Vanessa atalanta TaxID=42275 RepID=UPI001FCCFE1C|nr:chitobiosyldiphosphodolichol beta-mannosyltransferase [Vanessa atalanta]